MLRLARAEKLTTRQWALGAAHWPGYNMCACLTHLSSLSCDGVSHTCDGVSHATVSGVCAASAGVPACLPAGSADFARNARICPALLLCMRGRERARTCARMHACTVLRYMYVACMRYAVDHTVTPDHVHHASSPSPAHDLRLCQPVLHAIVSMHRRVPHARCCRLKTALSSLQLRSACRSRHGEPSCCVLLAECPCGGRNS